MFIKNTSHIQKHADTSYHDPEQIRVLNHLAKVNAELIDEGKRRQAFYSFLRKPKQVKGVYIWGGVGIGKTYMMDCFYHNLPFDKKMRIHFHAFMRLIHQQLKQWQGIKNPLNKVVEKLSREVMVLCLDELLVTDITDAMILARLFHAFSLHGICIIITSNMAPDDLYKRGLQREQFLPAIELIKEMTSVIYVPIQTDYRERGIDHLTEQGDFAWQEMEELFSKIAVDEVTQPKYIEIAGRKINVIKRASNMIWFDFTEICGIPRHQNDYLDIAFQYKTVVISNIPAISPDDNNTINLFIRMIDVFYDAGVKLIYSSKIKPEDIYKTGRMVFEFARTRSRLLEMGLRI